VVQENNSKTKGDEAILQQAAEDKKTKFKFDKSFQEKILQAMIMDRNWALQFNEVLDVDFFEFAYLKLVAGKYTEHFKKYKEFPSQELLITLVKGDLSSNRDSGLLEPIKQFFFRVESKKELGDLPYVKDRALDFCKKAALQIALEKCVDHIKVEKYDSVVATIQKAINSGNEQNPGLDLIDDIDARYSETYRKTIATGIQELDQRKILNGGLGAGELGFVVAGSGVGKSHILTHFGASAVKQKKNVIHYTFELNERVSGIRYDSHLTDMPTLECLENKHLVKEHYERNKDNLGKLVIKYFPTGQATVQTLKAHMEKLMYKGFVPDLLLIDYAGIMRSTDRNELLRIELKKVSEELRSLAQEIDVPVWSALQSNKEGSNSEVVDLTNMAESYGQAAVADFVLGLSRQSAQKATGFGNIFIAKNRAGMDGIKYLIHLDTSRSKLKILTDDEAASFRENENDDSIAFIRKKFAEIQGKK